MALSTGVYNDDIPTEHSVPLCTNNVLNRHEKGKRSDAREAPATRGGHAHGPFSAVSEISGGVNSPVSEVFPVTEEQKQPEPAPKDERDLIIEDLKARMDKIESDYQIKIGDYQKANAELWARLHPAKQDPAPPAQPEPVKDPYEVMLDSFTSALGIKKKKE